MPEIVAPAIANAITSRPPPLAPPGETDGERSEEFLFHLYRGMELLQDNRASEAKDELEQALAREPSDAKAQELLASACFRIGQIPRAIEIYERLPRDRAPALRVNLAVCYLKAGHTRGAIAELEKVVAEQPNHGRAWDYLGVAYERIGEPDRAREAFERGASGLGLRAKIEKDAPPPSGRIARPSSPDLLRAALLENGGAVPRSEDPLIEHIDESATGETTSMGAGHDPPASHPPSWRIIADPARGRPPSFPALPVHTHGMASLRRARQTMPIGVPESSPPGDITPPRLRFLTREGQVAAPRRGVVLQGGLAVARVSPIEEAHEGPATGTGLGSIAARLEAVRSYTGSLTTEVLERQPKARAGGEPFGGLGTPVVKIAGDGRVVLAPRPSFRLVAFRLDEEPVFVREELLLGFELNLTYENGRLALGEGESTSVVQLRGPGGCAILELMAPLVASPVTAAAPIHLRREAVVGWVGRLVPRALPSTEAPLGQRGILSFAGEGAVLFLGEEAR
jgi:hypothetical protein